jgi:hypothetical protein
MSTPPELDASLDRLLRREDHRSSTAGFGTTKQGQALARQYREQLTDRIRADRSYGRRVKEVWGALKGLDDQRIALRLLVAGISVAEGDRLGVDDDGQKNYRDQALWIGRNLVGNLQRKLNFKVGAWGINMLISLPAFALDIGDVLKMTAAADGLMDDALVNGVIHNALLSPLTTPPLDWTQVRKGGLSADHWAKEPLISERHPSIDHAARKAISRGRMRWVLDAVNALQRVAFTINRPVLDLMLRAGKPPAPDGSKPPIWQEEKRQEWNEALAALDAFHTDVVIAESMADADRFWVPLKIDFRGRIYGIPHFNFTREDRVRSLFLFEKGKPIGEEGLKWLKVHVAGTASGNNWSDNQKPGHLNSLGRIEWTDANLDKLCGIGRAVLRRDDPETIAWALPKKDPYQFIAACVELAQAIDTGPDFETRLPLMFDGSQSGLQHLCAMTRADQGAYVNMTAADEQDDFYERVARHVWDAAPDLRHLMEGPSDRDLVKRPAMSYFYGSKLGGFSKSKDGRWRPHGMTKQIIDVLKERRKNRIEGAEAKALAKAINSAIEDMAPRATDVRNFLEKLVRLCAKKTYRCDGILRADCRLSTLVTILKSNALKYQLTAAVAGSIWWWATKMILIRPVPHSL